MKKSKMNNDVKRAVIKSLARNLVNSESIAPTYSHEILGISEKEAYRAEVQSDEERGR